MPSAKDTYGSHRSIGIVFHRVGVPGCGITDAFLSGVARECATHKLGQVLSFFIRPAEFRNFVSGAMLAMVDGFIVGGCFHKELVPDMVELQGEGYPVVTTYAHPVNRGLVNIGVDQVGIGRMATEHLIECGCREIVHHVASDARLVGYRQALRANGIPTRAKWVYRHDDLSQALTAAGGEDMVHHYTRKGVSFDGVVASCDHQAMGVIRALLKSGRRVPEDVKVIGIDNSPLSDSSYVTITSVSDDVYLRGRLAVRALMDRMRGRAVKSMSLEPILTTRESTAETIDEP